MTKILRGKEVVEAVNADLIKRVAALNTMGTVPVLAIVRLGEEPGDMAYERGATKRAEKIGVGVRKFTLPKNTSQEKLLSIIQSINNDDSIHGVLIFRPLPSQIDDEAVRDALLPSKDVDGITDGSMAGVYSGSKQGFPPCTAEACMEILSYYGINVSGMNTVVIGRSLVIGRPAAMMLMKRNATVTICHTKTVDTDKIAQRADLLVAAAGRAKAVGGDCFNPDQIVIDVGINLDEKGDLCGDVDYEEAEGVVQAITPVPGGVGTVTTSMLLRHVVQAAEKQTGIER